MKHGVAGNGPNGTPSPAGVEETGRVLNTPLTPRAAAREAARRDQQRRAEEAIERMRRRSR